MEPIPTTIQSFLHANIESVDQLEILRLLASDPDRHFMSSELAKERHLSLEDIERNVRTLQSRGLLTILNDKPLTYKHGAKTPEIEAEVQTLLKTYLERPVSVIRMIYEHEKQLRLFAEAFRLKKED